MFDPSMLSKLSEMKSIADSSKQKLDQMTVEGESGGGLIRIALSGNREVRSVQINAELDQIPHELSHYIVDAAEEVISGDWDAQFPLVVWQTGSGRARRGGRGRADGRTRAGARASAQEQGPSVIACSVSLRSSNCSRLRLLSLGTTYATSC